jgi:hypothetical protein
LLINRGRWKPLAETLKVLDSLLLLICLALAQVEPSAETTSADLAAQVRTLVRQLDHNELAKRVAAEKGLIELGPAVLDLLPQVTAQTPAEVKQRLARVQSVLETAAIEAATQGSLVTLKGEMPLSEALAALEKQSGNRMIDYRQRFNQQRRDANVNVDFDKTPFWTALDQVLDQAGMTIYHFAGESGALAIVARSESELPRADRGAYSGLFRYEPSQIEARRDLRNPANHALRLTIEAAWEPRMTPIVLEQPLGDIKAVDDSGQPLEVDGRLGKLEVAVQGNLSAANLEVPFMLPDRSVKEIKTLSGTLMALVPGRVETFEFTDLATARNVQQRRGGVTLLLEQTFKNVGLYDVRIRVQFDKAANALESHRGWIYNNDAYMLDPSGQRVENAGIEATRQAINEIGLSYKFVLDDGLAGHTFVYKTPAAIVRMPVNYELRDIKLP